MKKKLIIILICCVQQAVGQTTAFATIDSLLQKGRYKMVLQKLQAINPPTFESDVKMATVYQLIDNHKKAVSFYEKALTFKNDDVIRLKLAASYLKLKNYAKTIAIYEGLSEKDEDNLLLHYQLAKLYLVTKQLEKAIEKFQFLIKKDPENANYSYRLGVAYAFLGARNKKIDSYLDAFKKDNQHIKAIYHLATAFKKIGDRDSSYLFVNKGLKINPNHIQLNRLKINKLYRDKNYLASIKLLKMMDSIAPKEFYTATMLGRCYYNLDSLQKAKNYFEKAKKLDTEKEDFKSDTYLGHIAMKEQKYMWAKIHYSMAISRGKRLRDEEYVGLANVFIQEKKKKQAIEMLKKATKENRNNYKVAYRLATLSDAYYKNKKIAYKLYNKFLERFESKDKEMTAFVQRRIREIKKEYFLKGETID